MKGNFRIKDFLRETAKLEFFPRENKTLRGTNKLKTFDNVKRPLIHLGNNKIRKFFRNVEYENV